MGIFLLIIFLIGLVTIILSLFVKKSITVMILVGVLIVGTVIFIEQSKYTTLFDLYSKQLNKDTVVKSVSISVNDFSEDIPEILKSVTIQDDEIIHEIIEDLSSIKLKRDDNIPQLFRDYRIEFIVTNEIEEKHFETTTIRLDLSENYVNNYKIISKTNHLRTIESLVEDDKIDWK